MLAVLDAIDTQDTPSQRGIASDLGIAVGMVNAYVKRCVRKGYVKLSQAPANRYLYYLTPSGLAEKVRLTGEYLQQSLSLFREARAQYSVLMAQAASRGWTRLALAGGGDMVEIAQLAAQRHPAIRIVGVIPGDGDEGQDVHLPVLDGGDLPQIADAVVVATVCRPGQLAAALAGMMPVGRVLTPPLLLTVLPRQANLAVGNQRVRDEQE